VDGVKRGRVWVVCDCIRDDAREKNGLLPSHSLREERGARGGQSAHRGGVRSGRRDEREARREKRGTVSVGLRYGRTEKRRKVRGQGIRKVGEGSG
jgi:hypothetical protein